MSFGLFIFEALSASGAEQRSYIAQWTVAVRAFPQEVIAARWAKLIDTLLVSIRLRELTFG